MLDDGLKRLAMVAALPALVGCMGLASPGKEPAAPGGGAGGGSPGSSTTLPGTVAESCTGAANVGDFPLRRLTRFEYENTVRELFRGLSVTLPAFTPEEEAFGFDNNAQALTVSQLLLEQYQDASEKLAAAAVANLTQLTGCDAATAGERACAQKLLSGFGRRAYRRPLSDAETKDLLALYDASRAKYDHRASIELLVQAMLQSPNFLYRVELSAGTPGPGLVRLNPYELASRLSYLFWGSMPDEALFDAAATGKLATADDVAAQARRMLADPKARAALPSFFEQWLGLRPLPELRKDAALFPQFTASMPEAMRQETRRFVEEVLWNGDGRLPTLLTANWSMVSPELAPLYGATASGSGFSKLPLEPTQRSGLLTQLGVLAVHAKPNQTAPVLRGKFIREQLLCQSLPPPPAGVVITVPEPTPGATTRQRFAEHSSSPSCKGCHTLMDPVGFGMENYDALGRYRAEESGQPIDASGEVIAGGDAAGGFNGLVELSQKLAASNDVRACFTTQWFRYGFGRVETQEDACSLARAASAFATSNHDVRELLVALTQTDAFLFRRANEVTP